MKNIKMGLTALAVFAVVGGALAFKTKSLGLTFCASTIQNSGCAVVSSLKIVTGAPNFFYDANWDGIPAHCNPVVCPTAVRFIND